MEHAFQATTVEMDHEGLKDLTNQLLDSKAVKNATSKEDIRASNEGREEKRNAPSKKTYTFSKGDQSLEIDDDFEVEMMADKRPVKMTLRELKDRAAGDVAVKNRMHALAEEKKRVQATFREFATLAKNDPLAALEFISNKAKEADGDFEYNQYIEKLADQAEKLGKMTDDQRKAHDLEKKLKKAEENLSHKERVENVVLRKQELLSDYPEIGDSEISQMVNAVLTNEDLFGGIENEHDAMDRVEELIQETLTQRDIMTVIEEINPAHINDNNLIFSLSDQLRQNPDLDEEDVRDILRELIMPVERIRSSNVDQRTKDIRTLSNKQRASMPLQAMKQQNATPYQLLEQQLLENREKLRKTPLNKR